MNLLRCIEPLYVNVFERPIEFFSSIDILVLSYRRQTFKIQEQQKSIDRIDYVFFISFDIEI